MSWHESSIMNRKGLAGGKPGRRHTITIEDQKNYHYVYGPYAEPIIEVDPGDLVTVETHDAFEGQIQKESDKPSEKLNFPYLNPQTGPIRIRGAEKGDALAVRIISIKPRGPQPVGTTCLIPHFGALVPTAATAMLSPQLPEKVKKVEVDEQGVYWSDKITLPYEPFIGTIGTAPEIEAISSLQPDYYGGNMDLPDVAPGNVIYLPVNRAGGLLYLGDCHAIQGDGEVCGVALEIPATVELQVDLVKAHGNAWPQLETEDTFGFIASARPMEDAARIGYVELINWVVEQTGQTPEEAYLLLTMCGKVRLGNMVDPKYTMGVSIEKKFVR
ncbi:acetamidase/formamidase family protein [Spiribacter insolitus]|uniref:Acetamidase/formamidase family protein n=1 Tax=Spiribacter insolitus TaxID=3122417 RepID=A0ABV3T4W0_9GAMM